MCAYIYTYIYIYICGPDSRLQGSKAGIPRMVPGAKNDFWAVPVSVPTFHPLGRSLETLQRSLLEIFRGL